MISTALLLVCLPRSNSSQEKQPWEIDRYGLLKIWYRKRIFMLIQLRTWQEFWIPCRPWWCSNSTNRRWFRDVTKLKHSEQSWALQVVQSCCGTYRAHWKGLWGQYIELTVINEETIAVCLETFIKMEEDSALWTLSCFAIFCLR